jgi:hypothetical protein
MTELLLYLSLAVTGTVVVVLVIYLVGIIIALAAAKASLAKLAGGLIAIRDNTAPLETHVKTINGGLGSLLAGLLAVNGDLAAIVKVAKGG